jgi:small-conductance mechanosensitive channel
VRSSVREAANEVARRPRFAPSCPEPAEVLGVVATDTSSITVRVSVRTEPGQRDALQRAVREAVVERLVADGLWPTPADPALGSAS